MSGGFYDRMTSSLHAWTSSWRLCRSCWSAAINIYIQYTTTFTISTYHYKARHFDRNPLFIALLTGGCLSVRDLSIMQQHLANSGLPRYFYRSVIVLTIQSVWGHALAWFHVWPILQWYIFFAFLTSSCISVRDLSCTKIWPLLAQPCYIYRSVIIFTTQSACGHALAWFNMWLIPQWLLFLVVLTSGSLSVRSLSWAQTWTLTGRFLPRRQICLQICHPASPWWSLHGWLLWITIPRATHYYQASHLWQIFIFIVDLANHMHFWYDWPPSVMQVGLVNSANFTLLCYASHRWQLVINSLLVDGSGTILARFSGHGQTLTKSIGVRIIAPAHKQYGFISTFVRPCIRIGHIK
jgi:hypothetical protein